jgi:2-hydroxychromene-2-carboxylate isomerase
MSTKAMWPERTVTSLDGSRSAVIPAMPEVADAMEPPSHAGNWLWKHYDNVENSYRNQDSLEPYPPPLTDIVTPDNPLVVDAFYSMRSPYSYLVLQKLTWLNSNYNCDVNLRIIFPVAVRTPGMFSGGTDKGDPSGYPHPGGTEEPPPKKGGRWYKWPDAVHDTRRVGRYEGIPFQFAHPDPIVQNHWPLEGPQCGYILPLSEQPYITWIVRLGNYAMLQGKALEFANHVSPLIWGNQSDFWPADVPEACRKAGLDYDAAIQEIQENPEKIDAVWNESQDAFLASGHGGVPNMVFRGEPFFGQDRFDHLFWRLRQNGLTTRQEPRAPFTTKPLRWPSGFGA